MSTQIAFKLFSSVALAAVVSSPAVAQDGPAFDIWYTQDCLSRAVELSERLVCVGSATVACMESNDSGYTTMGMNYCTEQELIWWDAELNRFYQKARALEKAEDKDMAGIEPYQSQADALRDMQRAWIPFRDAKCDYERAQWTGGTGGGPAWLSCLMHETAEQALFLEVMSVGY